MTRLEHVNYIFGNFSRRQTEDNCSIKMNSAKAQIRDFPKETSMTEEFICGHCKRQLVDPKVLPCLHSFCTECIQKLLTKQQRKTGSQSSYSVRSHASLVGVDRPAKSPKQCTTSSTSSAASGNSGYESEGHSGPDGNWHQQLLTCPTCGSQSQVPCDGVAALPPHYILQHRMLVASLNDDDAICLLCDLCTTEIPAVSRCTDCLLNLCSFCSKSHQRRKATSKHRLVMLEEARQHGARITRVRRQAMCPSHPHNELKLFCSPCSQVVCRDCSVLFHRGHACDLSSRSVQAYTCKVMEALDRTRRVHQEAVLSLDHFEAMAKRIQARCSQIQSEIDRYIDSYIRALEDHRRTLQMQVAKARESKLQALRNHQEEAERRTKGASHALRFGEELLAEGSEVEILSFVSPLLRRLEWCNKAIKFSPDFRLLETLSFLTNEKAGTINSHPVFGIVTAQNLSPLHSSLTPEGLEALNNCRLQKKCEVKLVTRDCEDQPVLMSLVAESIAADVRCKDSKYRQTQPSIIDRHDGTYLISFTPESTGSMSLSISIGGHPVKGSPFPVQVRAPRPHPGTFHCCTFCSSGGNKNAFCGCGGKMPGGYRGCGHGHAGHPGRRHWSCCGSIVHNSECSRIQSGFYQFTL